ncbi:signal peptidase I [Candidatus Gracilibacteria bacterium]|nr:signal peptidase I [Candidatus Gracilibacteria bacterium]
MIKDKDQSWTSFIIETLILIGVVLFIRFYIFQFFRVSGPSMCPTLNILDDECQYGKGEFIFVNEVLYNFVRTPKRGEISVFRPPHEKVYYIKRVIGIPGDTIEIKNGKVYLSNDEVSDFEIEEPYLSPRNQGMTQAGQKTIFQVPEDHYLLFGDNRAESLDARQCFSAAGCDGNNTPFVPEKFIQGRAEFVIWPLGKARWMGKYHYLPSSQLDKISTP